MAVALALWWINFSLSQLDHMQTVCTLLQRYNHANTSYSIFTGRMLFLMPNQQCHCTVGSFYRAMLCIRGTSHGPVSVSVCLSVCLSVTSRSSTKTAKRRITQTTPHDSPVTLVFSCQRSPRNSTGVTPYEGAECRWGGSKSATFD